MKRLLIILLLITSFSTIAQTEEDCSGSYYFLIEAKDGHILDYKMQLNPDKTFVYTSFNRVVDMRGNHDTTKKGKGTWKVENKIIKFTTELKDLDQDHTLNFTGTTARIVKKSPRDTSDKVVPTALQFYKSEIRTIENLKFLLKV
ncbi:hypothetical protein IVB69_05250 [Flavobacterium sp. J49]|uniref:hypothetical protein n=1 Tax=Flavobacterium sp. J49 TaxID=2718534 RepID=UPI001593E614|nr:hypothetical protein [Flavobacterium sp. J49]MBF6640876.1 hypothetical protein [Flavobacterium sp. J49]NIC02123.1 hypothetical protein [Flavobacterium sp. J49]